jgi:3-oxoacyl-[acyl-carrier protein] reductase
VIITGGGGAIGTACAKVFSQNDFHCVIVDQSKENAQAATESIPESVSRHLCLQANVSIARDIETVYRATIDEFGRVDALINCAALSGSGLDRNDSIEERWKKTIENDLMSVYLMSERAVVEMQKVHGGAIVNFGSIAGAILGSQSVPYAAAKAGIVGITKSHARIYGAHGIRVNCILPGIIETEMVRKSAVETNKGYFSEIKNQTPLKRWGLPSEIAELAYFLSSEKCAFLTGSTIVVDGGATLTLGLRLDEEPPFRWEKWPPKVS